MFGSKFIGLCIFSVGVILLFLWGQVQSTRLGYEAGRVRLELRAKRHRIAYLRMERARLYAPSRLAEAARQRLRMSPPSPEHLVFLENQSRLARGPDADSSPRLAAARSRGGSDRAAGLTARMRLLLARAISPSPPRTSRPAE